jgi:hypothetical protein
MPSKAGYDSWMSDSIAHLDQLQPGWEVEPGVLDRGLTCALARPPAAHLL